VREIGDFEVSRAAHHIPYVVDSRTDRAGRRIGVRNRRLNHGVGERRAKPTNIGGPNLSEVR
jgi:hypothetical protein